MGQYKLLHDKLRKNEILLDALSHEKKSKNDASLALNKILPD